MRLTAIIGAAAGIGAAGATARATLVCPPGVTDPAYCTDVAPAAVTGGATGVGATHATLHGGAGPGVANGDITTYFFEWGRTTRYGTLTPSHTVPKGPPIVPVSATLHGLTPCTRYDYALVATNADNTTIGRGRWFRTRFGRPIRSVRLPRRGRAGARLRLTLILGYDARIKLLIKHGRRTVHTISFRRVRHGRRALSFRAPATAGRYRVRILAQLTCGRQRISRHLTVASR